MRIVVVTIAALVGGLVGAVAGFALAMAVSKPRNDGTFGMREVLLCVPVGGLIGAGPRDLVGRDDAVRRVIR